MNYSLGVNHVATYKAVFNERCLANGFLSEHHYRHIRPEQKNTASVKVSFTSTSYRQTDRRGSASTDTPIDPLSQGSPACKGKATELPSGEES